MFGRTGYFVASYVAMGASIPPVSGSMSPDIIFISVDFPTPFLPTIAILSFFL